MLKLDTIESGETIFQTATRERLAAMLSADFGPSSTDTGESICELYRAEVHNIKSGKCSVDQSTHPITHCMYKSGCSRYQSRKGNLSS